MFDGLEAKIIFLLSKTSGTILHDQIVDYLRPDTEELEAALKSLLSDELLTERQTPDGGRKYVVNMDEDEYRLFFTQELIDQGYEGETLSLLNSIAVRLSVEELGQLEDILTHLKERGQVVERDPHKKRGN